jgi:DNA-binding NarL/FixJ family response regulator
VDSLKREGYLETATILIVDDFERWRRFVFSIIQERPKYRIIGEVSNGVEAVQLAQELRPNLILLDIGLPALNGIEAAKQIIERVPNSKILFLSENRSCDLAREALATGAIGYVVKSDAASELLPAMKAVLQGRQFVSSSLANHLLAATILSSVELLHLLAERFTRS